MDTHSALLNPTTTDQSPLVPGPHSVRSSQDRPPLGTQRPGTGLSHLCTGLYTDTGEGECGLNVTRVWPHSRVVTLLCTYYMTFDHTHNCMQWGGLRTRLYYVEVEVDSLILMLAGTWGHVLHVWSLMSAAV